MIAEVYPLKRMPRKFGVFDYAVPEGQQVKRGDFVEIPFRSKTLYGIVAKTKDLPARGIVLKELLPRPEAMHLRDVELTYFERLAFDLAQSVSTILHVAIPTPPKRNTATARLPFTQPLRLTIPGSEAPSIALLIKDLGARGKAFVKLSDLRRMAAVISGYLHEHSDDLVMVIAPNVRDAKLLARALCAHEPLLCTGEESNNARYAIWQHWRSLKRGVLVGTRVAALIPRHDLTTVFLARSGHPNQKQEDRNPRMDTRQTCALMHELFHVKQFFLDSALRVDDMAQFENGNILAPEGLPTVHIVDMNKEGPTAPHPMIGYTTTTVMEQVLTEGKQIICVYNKKGFSRQLHCADCGHTFTCPTCRGIRTVYEHTVRCHRCGHAETVPLSCPSCKGTRLRQQGFGNRAVLEAIQTLFPGVSTSLVEKDSTPDLSASILVVTRSYYENIFDPFHPPSVGLVVELRADAPLFEPSIRAFEHAIESMEEWRGVAHACRAQFLVQSQAPNLFLEYLESPMTVLERELATRITYDQPPAKRWMRIVHHSDEPRSSEVLIRTLAHELRTAFDDLLFIGPKRNEEYFYVLDIGCKPEQAQNILAQLSNLDDAFVIDTNVLF